VRFEFRGTHRNGKVVDAAFEQVMKEWDKRIDGLVEHLPAQLAEALLEEVQKKAPDDLIKGYPGYLKVRRIPSKVDGFSVYGVLPPGWAFSQRLRSVDVQRTVLYVRPKVVRGESEPAAVVLARKNPWTMNTLPYEPTRREASMMARQVSEREARKIDAQRKRERNEVVAELRALGKPIRSPEQVTMTRRVTRDLFFEVCRVEFGVETPQRPHWRPATRAMTSVILRKKLMDIGKSLLDPDDGLLLTQKSYPDARKSAVKKVGRFQDLMMPSSIG
jgi:hypothetical protein